MIKGESLGQEVMDLNGQFSLLAARFGVWSTINLGFLGSVAETLASGGGTDSLSALHLVREAGRCREEA